MPDHAAAEAFIDAYRRTFESFDVAAITALYAFPVQVVGDAGVVSVAVVPAAEAWTPQVERIVGAYRLLGVSGATVARLDVAEVTPGIANAVVSWSLHTAAGDPVYDFTAAYTLADLAEARRPRRGHADRGDRARRIAQAHGGGRAGSRRLTPEAPEPAAARERRVFGRPAGVRKACVRRGAAAGAPRPARSAGPLGWPATPDTAGRIIPSSGRASGTHEGLPVGSVGSVH